MTPARCGICGEEAISYTAHLVNLRPTRECETCGARVRMKGFWTLMGIAVVAGLAVGYAAITVGGGQADRSWIAPVAGVSAVVLLADYLAWRLIPWEPARGKRWDGEGGGGPAAAEAEPVESRENA